MEQLKIPGFQQWEDNQEIARLELEFLPEPRAIRSIEDVERLLDL